MRPLITRRLSVVLTVADHWLGDRKNYRLIIISRDSNGPYLSMCRSCSRDFASQRSTFVRRRIDLSFRSNVFFGCNNATLLSLGFIFLTNEKIADASKKMRSVKNTQLKYEINLCSIELEMPSIVIYESQLDYSKLVNL